MESTVKGRGFSTKFEDHVALIHTMAKRGYAWVQQYGVVMDYDDVYGDMQLSFVRAQQKYSPDAGVTFTAYYGRAAMNNFKKVAEKVINEQVGLGLLRIGDMKAKGIDHDHGEALDYYQSIPEDATTQSVEDVVAHREHVSHSLRALSPDAKKVLRALLDPPEELIAHWEADRGPLATATTRSGKTVRLMPDFGIAYIARFYGMSGMKVRRIKDEIEENFHVGY